MYHFHLCNDNRFNINQIIGYSQRVVIHDNKDSNQAVWEAIKNMLQEAKINGNLLDYLPGSKNRSLYTEYFLQRQDYDYKVMILVTSLWPRYREDIVMTLYQLHITKRFFKWKLFIWWTSSWNYLCGWMHPGDTRWRSLQLAENTALSTITACHLIWTKITDINTDIKTKYAACSPAPTSKQRAVDTGKISNTDQEMLHFNA